mmetsp:Transcript_8077/g.18230  ORF Transcript_8077/g.18230 Transcript_8077/m.18230 type:complete len:88 (+) Transcript_8077:1187-1450(+)
MRVSTLRKKLHEKGLDVDGSRKAMIALLRRKLLNPKVIYFDLRYCDTIRASTTKKSLPEEGLDINCSREAMIAEVIYIDLKYLGQAG